VNLSDASRVLRRQVEVDGFAVVPACLDEGAVEDLCKQFEDTQHPQRNLCLPRIPSVSTGILVAR
jgi:hypothetical protein